MINYDLLAATGTKQLEQEAHKLGGIDNLVRSGFPPASAFELQKETRSSNPVIESITGVSYRTLQRHLENKKRLSPVTSDRLLRFMRVLHEARETLGTQENVVSWMNKPCKPLNNDKPIDLLDTEIGTSDVLDILGRIRHGIFS